MALPSSNRPFWLRNKWWIEAITAAAIAIGTLVATLKLTDQFATADARMQASDGGRFSPAWIITAWITAGLTVVLAAFKAKVAQAENQQANNKDSPSDLYGCACVLHAMVRDSDGDGLRLTIHRVEKSELEQVVPYALGRGQSGGEKGRKFPIHCGIIGQVARTGKLHTASRESEDIKVFHQEMMGWGYTEDGAKDLDPSRWSWIAVPLLDQRDRTIGVVYLDSDDKGYFTPERVDTIMLGVSALKDYIRERYP